jgi:hypothetical protein
VSIAIKFVEAHELPAICVECQEFLEMCNGFPSLFDVDRHGYVCKSCGEEIAPAMVAALAIVCTGLSYGYESVIESPDASNTLERLRGGCLMFYMQHFAPIFGQPEPDEFLTVSAVQ